MTGKTPAQRTAAFFRRRARAGMVYVRVWGPARAVEKLRRYARQLVKKALG